MNKSLNLQHVTKSIPLCKIRQLSSFVHNVRKHSYNYDSGCAAHIKTKSATFFSTKHNKKKMPSKRI